MQITNLTPSRYKRFFAFGCSFTNYMWPTWADIIAQDIPTYQNWAEGGAGNAFIFNSIVEAHSRHQFKQDDLVMVMWSTKEREDRYQNNKWSHATASNIEKVYGKEWVKKFYLDSRPYLIHDAVHIKAAQTLLQSSNCDWANLSWCDLFNSNKLRSDTSTSNASRIQIYKEACRDVYQGESVSDIFDDQDVIKLYQDAFMNISFVYDDFLYYKAGDRLAPNNDEHPTPIEALEFLNWAWPNNTLSDRAVLYAKEWQDKIWQHNFTAFEHASASPTRL